MMIIYIIMVRYSSLNLLQQLCMSHMQFMEYPVRREAHGSLIMAPIEFVLMTPMLNQHRLYRFVSSI